MGLFDAILAPSYGNSAAEDWSNSESSSWQEQVAQSISAQDLWTDAESANANAAYQAELNRMFQAYMSNTAYQRAVNDLKAAGLNPILAIHNGAASTPTGATAQSFMNSYGTSRSSSSSYGSGGSYSNSSSYGYSNSETSRGIQNLGNAVADLITSSGQLLGNAAKTMFSNVYDSLGGNNKRYNGKSYEGGGGHKY